MSSVSALAPMMPEAKRERDIADMGVRAAVGARAPSVAGGCGCVRDEQKDGVPGLQSALTAKRGAL